MKSCLPHLTAFYPKILTEGGDNDWRYVRLEIQQQNRFNESMLQQSHQFADEEKLQCEGEKSRAKLFEEMMAAAQDGFLKNEERRENIARDQETVQEEVFQKEEKRRDKLFTDEEGKRDDMFRNDQADRLTHSHRYANIREEYMQQGHESRQGICDNLERETVERFKKTLQILEELFTTEESRRDGIVQEKVTNARSHRASASSSSIASNTIVNDGDSVEGTLQTPSDSPPSRARSPAPSVRSPATRPDWQNWDIVDVGPPITPPSPSRPPSRSPTRVSLDDSGSMPSIHTSHSPVIISNDEPVVTASSPPIRDYIRASRRRSSSPEQSPSRIEQVAIPSHHVNFNLESNAQPGYTEKYSSNNYQDYETRFQNNQKSQQHEFLMQEETRDARFKEAEARRDQAEGTRSNISEQTDKRHMDIYRITTQIYEERFNRRELVRSLGIEVRQQRFEVSQKHRSYLFEKATTEIEKGYSMMDGLKGEQTEIMKTKVEELYRFYDGIYERAQQRRATMFAESQARRQTLLGVAGYTMVEEVVHSPSSVDHELREYLPISPQIGVSMPYYPATVIGIESRDRSSIRRHRRYTRSRSRSPPTGFAAAQIFTKGDLNAPLLTPGLGNTNNNPKFRASSKREFSKDQQRRYLAFERAQAEREKIFEKNMQIRRHLFELSEARREMQFTKNQDILQNGEHERETEFMRAQANREMMFYDAERQREQDFMNAERSREEAFMDAQADRQRGFYFWQEKLQRDCFDSESRRRSALNIWVQNMWKELESKDEYWRNGFAMQQEIFQEQFIAMIGNLKFKEPVVVVHDDWVERWETDN